MAITLVQGLPSGAIKYTHETDSSADWSGLNNDTYFYDKTDRLAYYKNLSGTVLEVFGGDSNKWRFITTSQSLTPGQQEVTYDTFVTSGQTLTISAGTGSYTFGAVSFSDEALLQVQTTLWIEGSVVVNGQLIIGCCPPPAEWILENAIWSDTGNWIDNAIWND